MIKLLLLLRSIAGVILFSISTFVSSVSVIILIYLRAPKKYVDAVAKFWAGSALKIFSVKLIEIDRENIPDGPCLFLFNHTSFYDVFVLAYTVPDMRFGSKAELFNIPFFGPAMKLAGVLPIERSRRQKVFEVYKQAQKTIHANKQKYSLSPEGGRNNQEKLLPFKAGPFVFAIDAQVPIVPVIIKGACEVLPKNTYLPALKKLNSTITVQYLPVVSVEGYTYDTRAELSQKVFDMMKVYF